jgi:hypothetical protein
MFRRVRFGEPAHDRNRRGLMGGAIAERSWRGVCSVSSEGPREVWAKPDVDGRNCPSPLRQGKAEWK